MNLNEMASRYLQLKSGYIFIFLWWAYRVDRTLFDPGLHLG